MADQLWLMTCILEEEDSAHTYDINAVGINNSLHIKLSVY